MHIVVVGAGNVGSYLAARFSEQGQDVVLVERDESRAAHLQGRLDALVVHGNGASPAVLEEAGAHRADLLVAVSDSDGANVLACHVGHLLGAAKTVARVEDPDLLAGIDDLGVDEVIDPGEQAAQEVLDLVRQRGLSDLVELADGQLTLLGGIVRTDSPLMGRTLAELRREHDGFEWIVGALVRHGQTIRVRGETRIEENDHALVVAQTRDLVRPRRLLHPQQDDIERVVVVGATRVAELAIDKLLSRDLEVAVVDEDEARCKVLAARHVDALTICGDPTDPEVLGDLQLGDREAVAALSGWDDLNLTACLVAKALGASTTLARFHRLSYVGLLTGTTIDAAVSSRLAATNAVLHLLRRGRIHAVSTFKDTDTEALDIDVAPGSDADGCRIQDLRLPDTAVVGGVLHGGEAHIPVGATEIHGGDRIIVFAPPDAVDDVEALCT
jgi:trk system potassium uptake protein